MICPVDIPPNFNSHLNLEAEQNVRHIKLDGLEGINKEFNAHVDPQIDHLTVDYHRLNFAIPGEDYTLKLCKPLKIHYARDQQKFRVVDWDIECSTAEFLDLDLKIVRTFKSYLRKADLGLLGDESIIKFERLLQYIDQVDWDIKTDPFDYYEARVLSHSPTSIVMADGDVVQLDSKTAEPLRLISEREAFGADFKFGRNEQVLQITNVVPLS